MKITSRILQVFCDDYFEDRFASITSAKNFNFLTGVVSKIFAIKNAFATNHNSSQYDCYRLNEIFTIKKSIFAYAGLEKVTYCITLS